jgi:hypothetical protein
VVAIVTCGGPRLVSVEIRGFRAFGIEVRQLQVDAPITVVHAGNSQGKTSLAEALEPPTSGRSSRWELLGGAKAEYHDSLRNARLPDGGGAVYGNGPAWALTARRTGFAGRWFATSARRGVREPASSTAAPRPTSPG